VTEQRKGVEVSGGKGVIVGNYATVFQSFGEAKRPVASFIRSAQFRSLVDERTKDFIGREFIFDGIQQVLAGEEFASGYVVIRGEPGIGKTATAAMLVLRGSYVHHFNIASGNIRSPRQFLENVCAQLIARYGLDHPALPPQVGEDSGFLSQLLMEAADRARERDELPVVVVVDALDEADDTGLVPSANRFIFRVFSLPASSSSSRPARRPTTAWMSTTRPRSGSATMTRPTSRTWHATSRRSSMRIRRPCASGSRRGILKPQLS